MQFDGCVVCTAMCMSGQSQSQKTRLIHASFSIPCWVVATCSNRTMFVSSSAFMGPTTSLVSCDHDQDA